MNQRLARLLPILALLLTAACSKQEQNATAEAPASEQAATGQEVASEMPAPAPGASETQEAATAAQESAPAEAEPEAVSETDDPPPAETTAARTQPSLRLNGKAQGPATSARFKEGTHYRKLVPAQPTSVPPGKVEVIEAFWYGCNHCFALEPSVEAWRNRGKAQYVEFVRLPAMWNDMTRMHARLFYTLEVLNKLDTVHPAVFREIHVNSNMLNTVDGIKALLGQHGVSAADFDKTFSSFAVESKLQRADVLNRRYRVQSVPTVVVNGKYTTDIGMAGGEAALFGLIDELAASEHGS